MFKLSIHSYIWIYYGWFKILSNELKKLLWLSCENLLLDENNIFNVHVGFRNYATIQCNTLNKHIKHFTWGTLALKIGQKASTTHVLIITISSWCLSTGIKLLLGAKIYGIKYYSHAFDFWPASSLCYENIMCDVWDTGDVYNPRY